MLAFGSNLEIKEELFRFLAGGVDARVCANFRSREAWFGCRSTDGDVITKLAKRTLEFRSSKFASSKALTVFDGRVVFIVVVAMGM